jgi:hypothetical protein
MELLLSISISEKSEVRIASRFGENWIEGMLIFLQKKEEKDERRDDPT